MELIIAISIFPTIYILMLLVFAFVFAKHTQNTSISVNSVTVSIIVAFRNEGDYLHSLINSLLNQNYNTNFEIILVNDHSEDNYLEILSEFHDNRICLFNLPLAETGKKAALRYGVGFAQGEILFFTDADCVVPINWLSSMCSRMKYSGEKMLCGPVVFNNNNGVLQKLFSLEFMSLTGSGASGFFLQKPFMCNGANYAVCADVMKEASSSFNDKFSSGDDVFLLHYVSSRYKVGFMKSELATVTTASPKTIKEFFNQRIRWASKTTGYRNTFAVFTALVTFFSSLSVLAASIIAVFNSSFVLSLVMIFIAKLLADLVFMIPVSRFYQNQKHLYFLPLLELLYPFYVVFTAITSLFFKPYWKGRKIR